MMRRLFTPLALCLAILGGAADAEPWPARADPFVTDLADVLPAPQEAALRSELQALRAETGVEMTVLTIAARGDYDPSASIETFAAGLFNAWGIGDAARNDGILVLFAARDRELRVELGAAYDQGYDVLAEDIVSRFFLPDIRDGDPARGIVSGSDEVMARIARRHAAALPVEALPPERGRLPGWLPVALIAAGVGALALRRRLGKGRAGKDAELGAGPGANRRHEGRDDRNDRIPRAGARGDGRKDDGKGGGRSSGGGATGRW